MHAGGLGQPQSGRASFKPQPRYLGPRSPDEQCRSGLRESSYCEVCRASGLRGASADDSKIGAPSRGQGCPHRAPLWPPLLLWAPSVPSRAGACSSSPWAKTLPRGKKPSAQFPARLGHEAPALARAQAASAHALSGAGYWLAGGAGEAAARSAHAPAGQARCHLQTPWRWR